MTDATMNQIRSGTLSLTPAHVDAVVAEARAALDAAPSKHTALRRLTDFAVQEVIQGQRPLTAEVAARALDGVRAMVLEAPAPHAALVKLHDFVGDELLRIAEHRGLLADVRKRVAEEASIVRPPGAPAAITEREALLEGVGIIG